jgi:hypothetical protein
MTGQDKVNALLQVAFAPQAARALSRSANSAKTAMARAVADALNARLDRHQALHLHDGGDADAAAGARVSGRQARHSVHQTRRETGREAIRRRCDGERRHPAVPVRVHRDDAVRAPRRVSAPREVAAADRRAPDATDPGRLSRSAIGRCRARGGSAADQPSIGAALRPSATRIEEPRNDAEHIRRHEVLLRRCRRHARSTSPRSSCRSTTSTSQNMLQQTDPYGHAMPQFTPTGKGQRSSRSSSAASTRPAPAASIELFSGPCPEGPTAAVTRTFTDRIHRRRPARRPSKPISSTFKRSPNKDNGLTRYLRPAAADGRRHRSLEHARLQGVADR